MAERILVVDDQRTNAEMVSGLLRNLGYEVEVALDAVSALDIVRTKGTDLVISDILMPRMDGYEFVRRLRASPATTLLPVILVTSADPQTERVKGIEVGADDFIAKPVNWAELFGRVKRLLHVKALQDEIRELNARLEERVRDQVAQLERLSRMKRFFSRAVAEAIVAGGEELLEPHRREITAVFLDLRGFTAFTDRADPDEVMELLRAYHATLGRTVDEYGGTLEHFAGDGVMIFFNDPIEVDNPAERAIRMALDRPALFRTQIRALLRAAQGRELRIMLPMIADVSELEAARALIDREVRILLRHGRPEPKRLLIGAMIEVPALLWQLDRVLPLADFASVGSNDLMQFLFAADRGNMRVAERFDPLNPAALKALGQIVEAANKHKVPLTLCGEMAGKPLEAMALIGLGFRSISMAPASVGPVKAMILSLDAGSLKERLNELLASKDTSLREDLKRFAAEKGVQI